MDTATLIQKYYIWVIFFVGFPGNLASLATIIRMKPVTSLTCYVALLAIVDNTTLVIKLTHLLLQDYNLKIMSNFECKILTFLGNVFLNYASWIIVAMSIERFVAVWFPLKLGINWTIKRSFLSMGILFLFLSGVYIHLLWTITSYYGSCEIGEVYHNYFITKIWYWISACLYAIFPCIILFVFNFLIIIGIRKSADEHKTLTLSPSTATPHRDVTIMLIVVSVVFLILTAPICIFLLLGQTWLPHRYSDEFAQKVLCQQIAYVLCDTNHAVNVFLYFLSARRFRRHFNEIYRCSHSSSPDTVLLRNRTYRYTNKLQCPSSHIDEDTESVSALRHQSSH
ncbi:probable G-protein coupled receptor B0563.6 [Patella vulgata]|uniref:probable G-protein coupled receptor B0563.6 n=1 Tax=Patella vulgata TaxID=6465 RepID=UPI0021804C6F|nr:probable G-protein coupled receptor B0563.6 [Patella vulgata]